MDYDVLVGFVVLNSFFVFENTAKTIVRATGEK